MDATAPQEVRTARTVPMVLTYGQDGNGHGATPLFRLHVPENNRNGLFWRTMRESLNVTSQEIRPQTPFYDMLSELSSIAAGVSENGVGPVTMYRPSIAECFSEALGEYNPDGKDSWAISLDSALRAINHGQVLSPEKFEVISREFHAILTGRSISFQLPHSFEADFFQATRVQQHESQHTGALVEGLRKSADGPKTRDPRLLLVANAMVVAYAKGMDALNANY